MGFSPSEHIPEYLSGESLENLNQQQRKLFVEVWEEILNYLREEGKDPERRIGYEDSSVRPMARRIFQVFEHFWETSQIVYELTPKHADRFIEQLVNNRVRTSGGKEYSQSSKRKFVDALNTYFDFVGKEWSSNISFTDEKPALGSDPFRKEERIQLLNASMKYDSPPNYKNVSPEERARWQQYLAQKLGKRKDDITPDDWTQIRRSWKFPSLISSAQDGAMRAALIERLTTDLLDLEANRIKIPPEVAVKNDSSWEIELSQRSTSLLNKWLSQRANKPKYDGSDKLWLNREGNPYCSQTLNPLLQKLVDQAQSITSG